MFGSKLPLFYTGSNGYFGFLKNIICGYMVACETRKTNYYRERKGVIWYLYFE